MKSVLSWLVAVVCCIAGVRAAEPVVTDNLAAATLLTFGRPAVVADAQVGEASGSMADIVTRLQAKLTTDAAERAATARRAFQDNFGRDPAPAELAELNSSRTYSERMQQYRRELEADPARYDEVIRRAYVIVISREPYPEEIKYWRERGTLPFVLLVACIDNWARRNQPGLMVTSGKPTVSINCRYLDTVQLQPETAAEARVIAGLPAQPSAAGQTVIAAGAGELLSDGRISFVAVGRRR